MNSLPELNQEQIDQIIAMAWIHQVTLEEIAEKMNLTEADVIRLMRQELKPSSFRIWCRRMSDRLSEQCRLLEDQPVVEEVTA